MSLGDPSGGKAPSPTRIQQGDVKDMPSEDGLVFSNPLNPDESVDQIEEILRQEKREEWYDSAEKAGRMARRDNMPILVWFTNSRMVQNNCKYLQQEVFDAPEFREWASKNLVCLKFDANVVDANQDKAVRKEKYIERMRQKYAIRTTPTLLMLTPDGQVSGRMKGYRSGNSIYQASLIKKNAAEAAEQWEKTKTRLLGQGYRYWQGGSGVTVIAKLTRYDKGVVWLAEPDGSTLKTSENNLSAADQAWIAEEKLKRGQQ